MPVKDETTIMNLDDVYSQLQKDSVNITNKYSYIHSKRTKGKTVTMSLGRCWFNCLLPDKFPTLIDEPVDKKRLYDIVNQIYEMCDASTAAESLSLLNKESFKMSSIIPQTFDIEHCIIPENIKQEKQIELTKDTLPEEFPEKLNKLTNKLIDEHLEGSGIGNLLKSGGSKTDDYGILTLAKGPVMGIDGKISDPIISSLDSGYSGKEFYDAANDARRTYYIKAIGASEPGTLARHVTYANSNIKISKEDCKTKKYLEITVINSLANNLLGRFMYNEKTGKLQEITQDTNIIGKIIKLRSPLYCKDKDGICEICYGTSAKKLDTKQIGLIAGTVVNKIGVETYSMKARHESIAVKFKKINFKEDLQ